ncbi:hypothetical protein C8J56DRAFT_1124696 [Mycena floridula]|nr:hypothetical protein C8J56DRAFT_1124696 [Mycena floridula]
MPIGRANTAVYPPRKSDPTSFHGDRHYLTWDPRNSLILQIQSSNQRLTRAQELFLGQYLDRLRTQISSLCTEFVETGKEIGELRMGFFGHPGDFNVLLRNINIMGARLERLDSKVEPFTRRTVERWFNIEGLCAKEGVECRVTMFCALFEHIIMLKQCLKRSSEAISPIRMLSPDILRHIFKFALGDSTYSILDVTKGPWPLARVSRGWRQTVLSDPTLWASISVLLDASFTGSAAPLLNLALKRSRLLPISVTFLCKDWERGSGLFALLETRSWRWKSLRLFVDSPEFLIAVSTLPLGVLRQVSIGRLTPGAPMILPPRSLVSASSLQSLTLSDIDGRAAWPVSGFSMPWNGLKTISFTRCMLQPFLQYALLHQGSRLESFEILEQLPLPDQDLATYSGFMHRSLKRLKLDHASFIQPLVLRSLEKLEIESPGSSKHNSTSSLTPLHRHDALTELTLRQVYLTPEFVTYIRRTKSLRNIYVFNSQWETFVSDALLALVFPKDSREVVLPNMMFVFKDMKYDPWGPSRERTPTRMDACLASDFVLRLESDEKFVEGEIPKGAYQVISIFFEQWLPGGKPSVMWKRKNLVVELSTMENI